MRHTRKEMIAYLAIGLSSVCMLAGCGGNSQEATVPANKLLVNGEACNPAWISTTLYREFAKVSYKGVNYTASFTTSNDAPDVNSAPLKSSGEPWITGFTCGSTTTTSTTQASTTSTIATTTTTTSGSASVTAAAGGGWKNNAIATQTGVFTVSFDASVTASPTDAEVGLSNGAQTAFTGFPVMVRFNTLGKIDARNGGAYAAANSISFSANTLYHFRVVVDASSHTYSAYVKAPGGSEQTIGTNYAFRTEQATVSSINNWGAFVNAASGSETVSNFTIGTTPPVTTTTTSTTTTTPATTTTTVKTGNLVHPGMLTSLGDLQSIKAHIANGDQPWTNELANLKTRANNAVLRTLAPEEALLFCGSYNVSYDGTHSVAGCKWPVENGMDAYTFALLGYLTGDKTYSDKAITYIMHWSDGVMFKGFDTRNSPHTYGPDKKPILNNAPLQAGWTAPWFANAAEILRYTYSGWTATHTQKTKNLLNLMLPLVNDETARSVNNWLHSRIEAHMAIAVFFDDQTMLNTALGQWKANTPSYFYIAADGALPPYPNRAFTDSDLNKAWHSPTKYVPGMTMEICRDMGHQGLGARSIFNSLAMANVQGQGASVLSGNDIRSRLTTFLEEQAKWIKDKQAPAGICSHPIYIQENQSPTISDSGPIAYVTAYKFLSTATQPLPYTKDAIAASSSTGLPSSGAGGWVKKWETLTHHK